MNISMTMNIQYIARFDPKGSTQQVKVAMLMQQGNRLLNIQKDNEGFFFISKNAKVKIIVIIFNAKNMQLTIIHIFKYQLIQLSLIIPIQKKKISSINNQGNTLHIQNFPKQSQLGILNGQYKKPTENMSKIHQILQLLLDISLIKQTSLSIPKIIKYTIEQASALLLLLSYKIISIETYVLSRLFKQYINKLKKANFF
ncbi:hypothetical protein TTHERM_000194539 (macronuclear) [Tetrahymena thermophila SB210]|uniref:Uncharacterized protein n=1 Tax=Tetrahymena thermophila (strain SB210) TaxID=312017 RepID=W7XJF1_TETTS|nr:hypothetical protein TTHERM_000194539 [Tetrahymena thermophila SB210]EWS74104.1 hypothetical protein TTHERM_000194539 [Tetrahymena thermophila SB210]|eukprot:XP_012653359.1 hypothetical protein TTHERM_000194539 [Tetrahymena thermophila SB210]